jgi:type IV pilus assembly protein PilW
MDLGMALVELLVAMLIGVILLFGLVQIAAGARSSFRLQEGLAEVQESGRFVMDSLGGILRESAFSPEPWTDMVTAVGLTADTADASSTFGDRLAVRTWSDRNCFGNPNPVTDGASIPRFYLRESVLELNASEDLVHTCRYGPAADQFVTQLQRQGLVQHVEAFQVQFAEDTDGDGQSDRWVGGNAWLDEQHVLALRLAVLIRSSESVTEPVSRTYQVLDEKFETAADGKLRRVFGYTQAFLGRSG